MDDTSLEEEFKKIQPLMNVGRAAEACKIAAQTTPFSPDKVVFLEFLSMFLFEVGFADEAKSIEAYIDKLRKHRLGLLEDISAATEQNGSEWLVDGKSDIYENPMWDLRARHISFLLDQPTKVLDLGCGNMLIEKYLPDNTVYVPCDIKSRNEHCLVCDFEHDELPSVNDVSHIVSLGVINYLKEPDFFLRQLARYKAELLLTFKPKDLPGYLQGNHDLASYPTIDQVMKTLTSVGFKCKAKRILGGFDEALIWAWL